MQLYEPRHDKTNKMSVLPAQWVAKDPSVLHADSEDSDQTGRMPRLIWVFAGHTLILLVLSWGGSYGFPVSWSQKTEIYVILKTMIQSANEKDNGFFKLGLSAEKNLTRAGVWKTVWPKYLLAPKDGQSKEPYF